MGSAERRRNVFSDDKNDAVARPELVSGQISAGERPYIGSGNAGVESVENRRRIDGFLLNY